MRIVGALYPAAMLLIIVATGNHFFVDAALGGLVVVIGWLAARVLVASPASAPRAPAAARRHPPGLTASRTPAVWEATPRDSQSSLPRFAPTR